MKKFAKMSLVAAIALAGLTNVQAGSLEEAIKGVDISGKVRYRIEEISNNQEDQDVNIDLTVKVPVNEMVTFVSHLNLDNDNQEATLLTNQGNGTTVDLEHYYFQYANGPVTVLLGTQGIPGRQTDGLNASGIVGLYNAGAFTVGAASFYNSDVTSEMINSVIAMGSVGPVSFLGQYTDADDVLDAYNLKADATVGPAMIGVEYSEKDIDGVSNDNSTFKAYVSAKVAALSAKLTYAETGDNGGGSIDEAVETPAEYLLWQTFSGGKTDWNVWSIDASYAVTDKVSLRAAYAASEWDTANVDADEILGQVSYKMSSNLNTYIRYSEYDVDGATKVQRGRVEVQYTF